MIVLEYDVILDLSFLVWLEEDYISQEIEDMLDLYLRTDGVKDFDYYGSMG